MKTLYSIIKEGILSDDDDDLLPVRVIDIMLAVKPLLDAWINRNESSDKYLTCSTYNIPKTDAVRIVRKIVKDLEALGTYNYIDFNQAIKREMYGDGLLRAGQGLLFVNKNCDNVTFQFLVNRKATAIRYHITKDCIQVSREQSKSVQFSVLDSYAKWAFEIPTEVAQKIIDANEISDWAARGTP